jgi:hypothetical protein
MTLQFGFVSVHLISAKIQVVLAREHEIAKVHLAAGRKDRALVALRQRKYQQSLLSKTDSHLETLEQLGRLLAIAPVLLIC